MSKKVITILLMSTLLLSLACGCKNNDTENTSSTASKTESSISSSTESSKQSESKAESSKQSESSTDKDYEEMMSYVNKLSPELTGNQVIDILGEPDAYSGSGIQYTYWYFGKHHILMEDLNYRITIYDDRTGKSTEIYTQKRALSSQQTESETVSSE